MILPLQSGVDIFCLIGPAFGIDELRPDHMAQHLLEGLAVLFVDTEKEEGQHQSDHQQSRCVVTDTAPCEKIGGDANQTARAKAYKLAAGQVEGNLCFDFREVLWDRHKWHYLASLSF